MPSSDNSRSASTAGFRGSIPSLSSSTPASFRSSTAASLPTLPRASTAASSRSGTISRAQRSLSSAGSSSNGGVLCAISEARGVSRSIGITFVNINTSEAIVSQICDTQFYTRTLAKIRVFEPSRILVVATKPGEISKSHLISTLQEDCYGIPIKQLDRKYWSERAGLEFIEDLAFLDDKDAVQLALEGNFYAVSSFAAAIKYLEVEYSIRFPSHHLRVKYQPSEDTMMIDAHTIQSLELMQNLQNTQSKDCLLGLLNNTSTPMGMRSLRSNILQPSTLVDRVTKPRLDAVQELSTNEDMFFAVKKALKEFMDVEKMLSALTIETTAGDVYEAEEAINSVLKMKKFVMAIPDFYDALSPATSEMLTSVRAFCAPEVTDPVINIIRETVNEDVTFVKTPLEWRNQMTYCVKSGVHGLLDVSRTTYKEATDDLHKYVEDFNTELNLTGEVKYDNSRRYYLRYELADLSDGIPNDLIHRVVKKKHIECQTLELVKFNHRIVNTADECVGLSDRIIQALLAELRGHIPSLFRICETIGIVDMLASFAQIVTTREYTRPEFDPEGRLALRDARHPILDTQGDFIPNNYFSDPIRRFQMLTGCNMSGKSTYIRAVALLQVMAQIGCFVPTKPSTFPVIHNLFCRVSTDDSIEANMSTFSKEMKEIAFILRNIDNKSLAIVDELGRGTSTRDGLSIAIAIAEALVQSRASVFFATHFTTMAHVMNDRPGLVNLHLATEDQPAPDLEDIPKMTMLYKLKRGTVKQENYGLDLAEAMGLPAHVLRFARQISGALAKRGESSRANADAKRVAERRALIMNLGETLKSLADGELDGSALVSFLSRVQVEFTWRMSQLEDESDEDEGMCSVSNAGTRDSDEDGAPYACSTTMTDTTITESPVGFSILVNDRKEEGAPSMDCSSRTLSDDSPVEVIARD